MMVMPPGVKVTFGRLPSDAVVLGFFEMHGGDRVAVLGAGGDRLPDRFVREPRREAVLHDQALSQRRRAGEQARNRGTGIHKASRQHHQPPLACLVIPAACPKYR